MSPSADHHGLVFFQLRISNASWALISLLLVKTGSVELTIWPCSICQLAGYSHPLKLNAVTNHTLLPPRGYVCPSSFGLFHSFLCFDTVCSIYKPAGLKYKHRDLRQILMTYYNNNNNNEQS